MGIGHHGIVIGKAVQVGPVYLEKRSDGSQKFINTLINGAKAQIDEFGGQTGNQSLEPGLEGKLRLTFAQALLQVLVVLDVVELAVPERDAIRLALGLRMNLELLVTAMLKPESGPIAPSIQPVCRGTDTGHNGINILRMDHGENRIRVITQICGINAKERLHMFADKRTAVGTSSRTHPI